MKLFFTQLKPHWKPIVIILIAHLIQAYTTLLLPTYTSGLVDTGIQNQGFEYAVPLAMTEEEANQFYTFLLPEEIQPTEEHYEKDSRNNVVLSQEIIQDDAMMAQLEATLMVPMAMYQSFQTLAPDEQATLLSQIDNLNMNASDSIEEARLTVIPELKTYGDTYIQNSGVQASLAMFQRTGQDTNYIQFSYLLSNGAQMAGIAMITIAAAITAFYFASRVGAAVGKDMRSQIFRKVLSFSNKEIEKYSTASLITRTTNDIQQVTFVFTIFLRAMLFSPILAIGGLAYIMTLQSSMSWILAISISLIAVFVVALFALTMPKYKVVQNLFDRVNLVAREILTGLQVIRAFGRQKFEHLRFDKANIELRDNHMFTGRTMSMMMPFMLFILDANSVLVVWFASHNIAAGTMQVGEMMAFISYSMQVLMSFLMVSSMSIMFPRALVSLRRIVEVLETTPIIEDSNEPVVIEAPKGLVAFNDVTFSYDDADAPTVEKVSFTAKPGQTTAIIGSTGSGKSTLLSLLMRFHDVTEGSITIDGVDIRNLSQNDLHALIGYVPQKGVLFSGTIKSNISYGVDHISQENLARAAEIAHASDFIAEKKAGYDAPISQGGSNVSGGQKQRLSIARAIAKDPSIYVFDDSFSALDYRTDASLRQALNEAVSDATLIIVAQRISTILDAEQIIVLNEGIVEGIGNHTQLMHSSNVYREIAESQMSQAELEAHETKQTGQQIKEPNFQPGWEV